MKHTSTHNIHYNISSEVCIGEDEGWGEGSCLTKLIGFFQDSCRCLDQLPKGLGLSSLRKIFLKLTLLVDCPQRSEFAK